MKKIKRTRKGQFKSYESIDREYVAIIFISMIIFHLLAMWFNRPSYAIAIATTEVEPDSSTELLLNEQFEIKVERDFMSYLEQERKDLVREYLQELNAPDVNTFLRIGKAESSYRSDALPPVEVRHCRRSNNTYYVVEVMNGRQASCRDGDIQVHAEKSVGIFQILPSTAKRVCGDVDLFNWRTNIECAVKIQARSGFTQWSTF